MPVCITGMHRSGTSLVTRLLNLSGVYLGPDRDMMVPTGDNPEGYWENLKFVQLNDQLLQLLGGGWDCPPVDDNWPETESLERARKKARLIISGFAESTCWGWKDPRNSILARLWSGLL